MAAWQKARELTRLVYAVTGRGRFVRDFALVDQLRRASVSVMSNIAEGFERRSRREFAQFRSVAKGSSGEVRAQLYVALDQGYVDEQTFRRLSELAHGTSCLVGGLARCLRTRPAAGDKQ
jgi:four helix bundle protein